MEYEQTGCERFERSDPWGFIPFADQIGDTPADKAVFFVCLIVLAVVIYFGG